MMRCHAIRLGWAWSPWISLDYAESVGLNSTGAPGPTLHPMCPTAHEGVPLQGPPVQKSTFGTEILKADKRTNQVQ